MGTCQFVLPGKPRGKQVARVTKWGSYTPPQTKAEMDAVKYIAAAAMGGRLPFPGPVELKMVAYLPVPASWTKAKRAAALAGVRWAPHKPDLSNITKLIEDGMLNVVYVDDSQVVRHRLLKLYGADPRVVVHVTELDAIAGP